MKPGRFGGFGGRYVPETLMQPLIDLEKSYDDLKNDQSFQKQFAHHLKTFVGRETPLYFAENLSNDLNVKIYLKREDLTHTGSHKINNALGQILLALKMGKKRLENFRKKLYRILYQYQHKCSFFTSNFLANP